MKKEFLYIFIFFLFSFGYSQSEEEEILKIILKEINFDSNEGVLQCEKGRIFFLKEDYEEIGQEKVPAEILDELEKAATELNRQDLGKWGTPCISQLRWKKKQTLPLIAVSNPIFDSKKEYCIIAIKIMRRKNSVMGVTYILRKKENKWSIVETLDIWIT